MRRILLTLIVSTLLSSPAWAWGTVMISGGVEAVSGYTEEYFWNGDYSGDTDKAEITHRSTQLDGTLTGATVVAGSSDPGTASSDGGNCLKLSAWSNRLSHAVTTGDIFSSAEGYISFYVYGAPTATRQIFLAYYDSSNFISVRWMADNTISIWHYTSGGNNSVASSAVTDNTWTLVSARWSDSGNTVGIRIGAGAWSNNAAAVAAFASEPATIVWGNNGSGYDAGETWLDGMQIWTNYAGT